MDLLVLERGLKDGVEHVKAGLVRCKARAPSGHAAKWPCRDLAVWLPAPRAAPVLHLDDLDRRFAYKRLDHILVGQVVRALDGVEGVGLIAVLGAQHGRRSTLSGDGVAAHGINLGDHPDLEAGIDAPRPYRPPHARPPPADPQRRRALQIPPRAQWYSVTSKYSLLPAPPPALHGPPARPP